MSLNTIKYELNTIKNGATWAAKKVWGVTVEWLCVDRHQGNQSNGIKQ